MQRGGVRRGVGNLPGKRVCRQETRRIGISDRAGRTQSFRRAEAAAYHARALVRKPEILILDDSASALDFATDAALRKAIRSMKGSPTVFIVSQRASSVQYADQIIVLDDGAAAGIGTHDELLAACPAYQEIYYSQFPKEAAVNG